MFYLWGIQEGNKGRLKKSSKEFRFLQQSFAFSSFLRSKSSHGPTDLFCDPLEGHRGFYSAILNVVPTCRSVCLH